MASIEQLDAQAEVYREQHDRPPAEPMPSTWGRDDWNEDVRDATAQAVHEARGRAEHAEAADRCLPHYADLESRYPGADPHTIVRKYVEWDELGRRDPAAVYEQVAAHYLTRPIGVLRDPQPPKAETPPADWRPDGQQQWDLDNDVKRAMANAVAELDRDAKRAAVAEANQLLRQRYPHLSPEEAWRRVSEFDRDGHKNALHTAARLAAANGMPITDGQVRQVEHGARVAQAHQVVEQAKSGDMPALAVPEVYNLVGDVLEDPNFPRVGSAYHDLRNAYNIAMELALAGHQSPITTRQQQVDAQHQQREQQREAVERSKRASRSISGSQAPGGPAPRHRAGNDAWDDAAAAYHSVASSGTGV